MVKNPSRFHIRKISLSVRDGLNVFVVNFEVRDLMKMYRNLKKRNVAKKECEKIERLLNSYAKHCNFNLFNIDDNISTARIGVNDDD